MKALAWLVLTVSCSVAADHPVRVRGKLDIPQTFRWDLDNGVLALRDDPKYTPDIWYNAHSPGFQTLDPQYAAVLGVMGEKSVGYEGCSTAKLSPDPVDLGKLKKALFFAPERRKAACRNSQSLISLPRTLPGRV